MKTLKEKIAEILQDKYCDIDGLFIRKEWALDISDSILTTILEALPKEMEPECNCHIVHLGHDLHNNLLKQVKDILKV
jgi:hypothetical protein